LIEVERKYWLNNKNSILKLLNEKAVFQKEVRNEDIYYIDKTTIKQFDRFSGNEKIFRLRRTNNRKVVTFKEKILKQGTEVNREGEFEIKFEDESAFKQFINYINYQELIHKTKETKLFRYQDVSMEYNYLHSLGWFLEGEILCEKSEEVDQAILQLDQVFNDFGLDKNKLEKKMYIELLLERKKNE